MFLVKKRLFHSARVVLKSDNKRPTSWDLPDLDKLPGGFRGKVYNKRDWTDYLSKRTDIIRQEEEREMKSTRSVKPPPAGWRKNRNLPEWLRNKYALKEKALKMDLSKVKKLSPATASAIRTLHDEFPEELPTDKLAEFFKVSPVAISKILKSRWSPSEKEYKKLEKRWQKRFTDQVSGKLVEAKFTEFIEETEKKLKMEIPPFFREKLYQYYKETGVGNVEQDLKSLNDARIEKEKMKEARLSGHLDDMTGINNNNSGANGGQ